MIDFCPKQDCLKFQTKFAFINCNFECNFMIVKVIIKKKNNPYVKLNNFIFDMIRLVYKMINFCKRNGEIKIMLISVELE